MQYGHFDNEKREYVIDRVDLPTSWTNYLGTEDLIGVINHTAGGYLFYKSAEYHRITRFRGNSIPMDRPGHYIYIRDDETGDYWSVSWQPVGKPLDQAKYTCRHGLSYSVYTCEYNGIYAEQTLFIPRGEAVELWDLKIEDRSGRNRKLSVFSYAELSFHHINIDNRNFQMSLYCAGADYADGIIEQDLHYEQNGWQYFAADFTPDSFDADRDAFLGLYRTENNPIGVEKGELSGFFQNGGNQCASLHKRVALDKNGTFRACFMLGEGRRAEGVRVRQKFATPESRDRAMQELAAYWDEKCTALQISTPNSDMNTMINIWTFYQSEVNVKFSRFASFIEVGGRTGLGYRDTAQDSMCVPHADPEKCEERILHLLNGLTKAGYGLHLFEPEWFEKGKTEAFKSPTVVPTPAGTSFVHGIEDACSDDALWLIPSIVEYICETGDNAFIDRKVPYADGGEDTVYDHMKAILEFSGRMVGQHGICQGLKADWNDCLNLGGGESALVSYLHIWALDNFVKLAKQFGRDKDAEHFSAMQKKVTEVCEKQLWDGKWFLRGFTKKGRPIGTDADKEGKIHLESNTWAVICGAAGQEKGEIAMDSIREYLGTPYGIMLNAPAYTVPDEDVGFVTRVYPGLKENAAIFSHPNPWAWVAECILGRGDRAMELYDSLCPAKQNDMIEIRKAEPYSYCQFISGRDHTAFGEAHHPFMTGSGGWSYFAVTHYMLGIRPDFNSLEVNPCIPKDWDGFKAVRRFRGANYNITVENPKHVSKGVAEIFVDGKKADTIPVLPKGQSCEVKVVMG
ncbi:MAG: N,N'-diacetylchitobiose phosphorylase [Spirochaetaceae bacterium]|jgi:N,N'-diacetylchitobiose phosphorylase|nr:N,N'-diacetylchitobiose phosphorylase [Spirochaetaceae bacterium]